MTVQATYKPINECTTATEIIATIANDLKSETPTIADLVHFVSAETGILNKLPFEERPIFAQFNQTIDTKNFAYEAYARLGACFRAIGIKLIAKPLNFDECPTPSPLPSKTIYLEYLDKDPAIILTPSSDQKTADQFILTYDAMTKLLCPETFEAYKESQSALREKYKEALKEIKSEALKTKDKEELIDQQIKNMQNGIETTHWFWVACKKTDDTLKHPIAPIIKAWHESTTAKPITREYERKHPCGILPQKSAALVRDIVSETTETGITQHAPLVGQLMLPTLHTPSLLPSVLPIQTIEGISLQTKKGQVSMPIRLFFEAVMALNPKERMGEYCKNLGDLVDDMYCRNLGNLVDEVDAHFTERIQRRDIVRVINGIRALDQIRIQYTEPTGGPGYWRPVCRPQRTYNLF